MEGHLQDWLNLLIRWFHFIAGVAWIGASFYFNWLENHLRRRQAGGDVEGDLWAIHGGGFYYLKKFRLAPGQLPPELHWFKWEAYATWLSGFALLGLVFYQDAGLFLVDSSVADIPATTAILIGVGSLIASWLFYDALCRSPLGRREAWLALLVFAWFALLAWALGLVLSGRGSYIHVGAAIGTVMVGNVFRVIIPSQKDLVAAVADGRAPDATRGAQALQRSRHNNYLTLPVLFIMISSHFPATYGHPQNWLVLVLLSLAGVAIRHYFNIRHRAGPTAWPLAPAAVLLGLLVWYTAPEPEPQYVPGASLVDTGAVFAIVRQRCVSCHSATPDFQGFTSAPLGVELDTEAQLLQHAERVYRSVVITRTMPLGNLTRITGKERHAIANWFEGLEDISGD